MDNPWEDIIRMFRQSLLSAFDNWLEKNRNVIGEKWYSKLRSEGRECATAIEVMATSMWIFNMISAFGVLAGIGPDQVSIHEIREELDKQSTVRLLHLIKACMNLQYLPRDVIKQEIPIISAKRFSLKLFTEQH